MRDYKQIWFVPDIHGEYEKMMLALANATDSGELAFDKDLIVFGGDLVDRGPDSRSVLRKVRNLQSEFPDNVVVLLGNHEDMMVAAVKFAEEDLHNWAYAFDGCNGGGQTLDSYKDYPEDLASDVIWLSKLPYTYRWDEYFFSHAPISHRFPSFDIAKTSKEDCIWGYPNPRVYPNEQSFALRENGVVGVCGHVHSLPRSRGLVRNYDYYIYCDVGCGCNPNSPAVFVNLTKNTVYESTGRTYQYKHQEGE